MKKLIVFAAIAATLLASCAKTVNTQKNTGPGEAISFGVYTAKPATKAVSSTTFGQINTNALLQASVGFGVFAYYSDAVLPDGSAGSAGYTDDPSSNFVPNFMYNQLVEYDTDHWTYAPVKYWPNEYNTSDAIGEGVDKLTFFAYAPHVSTVGDEGITGFSANNATGDPTVSFKVPASKESQIDLLYSDADTKNMVKPAIGTAVNFTFKHALSNLTILPVVVVDAKTTIPASSGTAVDAATVVKINSLTLTGQFNQEGTLNLATGVWTSSAAASDQTVTWAPATPFDVTAINDKADADAYYTANANVLPEFMFIPSSSADKDYVITIDYDFITTDAKLAAAATVHNVIHKTIEDLEFEKGKKMKLYVGLGMTSIVLSAEVADWTDDTPADVWLPVNL